ncbi:hypothetical protein LQ757_09710 [Agromyces sp. SYSU K20354]|uniref:hypothetical protein n=1 Tax=Agromyces cavernae TaxID=2898659 RepID=UPI001E3F8B4A|nr:hypothetical protein [Agromyces cavernae]MCD2442548.1 hypothetical protein [Agromyces cavernae]
MNTTSTPLRLTAAASVVALAVTLAGCANAEQASSGESRSQVAIQVVVTSAMHRTLVREEAGRYVRELLVRARLAAGEDAALPSIDIEMPRVRGH